MMEVAIGVALLIGIPVLLGVLGFRTGRAKGLITTAFVLWTGLLASFILAVFAADDLDHSDSSRSRRS